MKNFKKWISPVLAGLLIMPSFAFTSCKEEEEDSTAEAPKSEEIVLADFEKFEPDFQLMRLSKFFGAVNVNTDTDYVKSGKTSAKVQPLGHVPSKSDPMLFFPLSSVTYEYDYKDFTYFDNVNMWVYNAEEETIEVEIGFVETMLDIKDYATIPGEVNRLKPGWNKIVYYPDLNALNLLCDITNFLGVYLRFENTPSYELEDAPVLYIDDVQLKKSAQQQVIEEVIKLDEGEILNFDKDWQQNVLIVNAVNASTTPELSIVRASEENIPLLDDGRTEDYVLKLVTKASGLSGWPSFEIPAKVIQKSGATGIPKAERSKYNLCYDVYAVQNNKNFVPLYGVPMWTTWWNDQVYPHTAKVGTWTTYRQNLTLVSSSIYGSWAGYRISWSEYAEGGDMTFYFDNFRLEYVGD